MPRHPNSDSHNHAPRRAAFEAMLSGRLADSAASEMAYWWVGAKKGNALRVVADAGVG